VSKKDIIIGVAGLLLLGTAVTGLTGWYKEHQRLLDMTRQVAEQTEKEKRSAIVKSVSKQMEEIAYQQKAISDEQREEAIQQKKVADEMRLRSEVERQNALIARQEAEISEQQAQDARLIAENERQMAEHQRIQAEFSKRVADTLSYIALGRSLGNLSIVQGQVGNTELADLLAYASYHYISKYDGDVYYPAVFQALMTASLSKLSWPRHNGSVLGIESLVKDKHSMVSVSSYGEIILHKKNHDQLESKTLFSNKDYDFRDVYVDNNDIIYVVSRGGHLVIIENGVAKIVPVPLLVHPQAITFLDEQNLLLVGEQGLAVYSKERGLIVATRELDFRITAFKRYDNRPMLFDNLGRQHTVYDINDLKSSPIPVKGTVTAFASSKNTMQRAYGMSDGTIYMYDEKDGKITKLGGHMSRISKLKLNGNKLFSASYDGRMNLWNVASEKIEPMTLMSTNSWIMSFTFDQSKQYAWMGDRDGDIIEALMSVPMMVDIIRNKLKRDFTKEEWNYYIGDKVPYESFRSLSRKEVAP